MGSDTTRAIDPRASPRDRRPPSALLYFALLAPPAAWLLQLNLNFGLASFACFPRGVTRASFLPGWEHVWSLLLAVNLLCAILGAAGIGGGLYSWLRLLRPDRPPDEHDDILEPGEGRLRVFAAAGVLIGALFTIAILFNTVALSALSTCSQA